MQSQEIRLKKRPVGIPESDDFEIVQTQLPEATDGEIVVENVSLTVDPYMRGRMVDRKSYTPPFQIGETLTGGAIGRVTKSNSPDISVGEYVESHFGWREGFVAKASAVKTLGNLQAPASSYLGVLGMPGMTAYVGLLGVGEFKEGDVVFVSGAAGAVGSAVGQIAKIKGGTAIGSAGGEDKVRHLTEDLGFDHAFDYRKGHLEKQIQEGAPDGIDIYFDNVGGDHLQAALNCMRPNGRIPLCGAISQYNATAPVPGPNNLTIAIGMGLTLKGFIVSNYNDMRADFDREMTQWVTSGKLKYRETIFEGLENMPQAFVGLFDGTNTGKMIVNLQ